MSLPEPVLVCSWQQRNKEPTYDESAQYEWPLAELNALERPSGRINDSSDDRSNSRHARIDAPCNLPEQPLQRLANAPNSVGPAYAANGRCSLYGQPITLYAARYDEPPVYGL